MSDLKEGGRTLEATRRPIVSQGIPILASSSYLIAVSAAVLDVIGVRAFSSLYAVEAAAATATIVATGALLDRFRARSLLLVADLGRLAGYSLLAHSAADQVIAGVVAGMVLVSVFSTIPPACVPALLSQIAPGAPKPMADWRVASVVGGLLGPLAVASLLPTAGATLVLWLCALTCAVALAVDLTLSPTPARAGRDEPLWCSAVDGLSLAWNAVPVRSLLLLDVVHVLVPVSVWMLLLQTPDLVGIEPGQQGLVIGGFAAGGVGGALFARRHLPSALTASVVGAQALFAIPLAALTLLSGSPKLVLVIVAAVVGGAGNEASSVWMAVLISREVPPSAVGRIFSLNLLASVATLPIGLLAVGWAAPSLASRGLGIVGLTVLLGSSAVVHLLLRGDAPPTRE